MEYRIIALEARWEAVLPTSATKADLPRQRVQLRGVMHYSAMVTRAPSSACEELLADIRRMSADIKFWTRVTVVAIPCTMLAALLGLSLFESAPPPPTQIIVTNPASTPK